MLKALVDRRLACDWHREEDFRMKPTRCLAVRAFQFWASTLRRQSDHRKAAPSQRRPSPGRPGWARRRSGAR